MRVLFILFFVVWGCATEKKREDNKGALSKLLPLIKAQREIYLEQSVYMIDGYGWDKNSKCDGLLFNSLWALGGIHVNLEMAKDDEGKWYRHASHSCYNKGEANSEISRDMFLGLLLYILEFKRLDILQDLIKYGEAHNWRMGEGDKTKTGIRPNLKATIFELQHRLGGGDSYHRKWPQAWSEPIPFNMVIMKAGYETHIQVLHIYLRGLIIGHISVREYDLLRYYSNREPRNVLFSAMEHLFVDRNMVEPIQLMLDRSLFPADHLPTNDNYCTDYLFQRNQFSESWKPCSLQKIHTGIDWLFAYSVIMKGV